MNCPECEENDNEQVEMDEIEGGFECPECEHMILSDDEHDEDDVEDEDEEEEEDEEKDDPE